MVKLCIGDTEYFPEVGKIQYEGKESKNRFAYKYYNAAQVVGGKTMEQHFRFAVAYWHSFCNTGSDPFGSPTKLFPWLTAKNPDQRAREKMDAAFEFTTKLGVPFYCFHDYDLVDEGPTMIESERRLSEISDYALEKQAASGLEVLWGTANLFSHPRFMNGASTNPDFDVVARAAAQVKIALDTTIKLGGHNYVFWGGREGYLSLLNTDMKRELDHMGRFLGMARDYARSQGFKGWFFIEPKPMEPSKHQYDFDSATVLQFLAEYDLSDDFKLNVEVNHATLASHTFQHELQVAANANALGSMDANRGDYQNGWDTDQFPMNLNELTEAMLVILESDGFTGGGINFDAKTRRNSTDVADIVYAHIGGIDAFARALLAAHHILEDSDYRKWKKDRYASFDSGAGADFEKGQMTLSDLHQFALESGEPQQISGRQELFENLINDYI